MVVQNGAILGYPNFLDSSFTGDGYESVVVGGGDWLTTRPLTNLLDREFAVTARSQNLVDTEIHADLGVLRDIGVVNIPKGNYSRQSRFNLLGSIAPAWIGVTVNGVNSSGATSLSVSVTDETVFLKGEIFEIAGDSTIYQVTATVTINAASTGSVAIKRDGVSGTGLSSATVGGEVITCRSGDYSGSNKVLETGLQDVWEIIYPWGTLPYGHPSLADGKASEEERSKIRIPYVYIPPQVIIARYWKLVISDSANSDGYISLSRMCFMRGNEPSNGIKYGARQSRRNETTVVSGAGTADVFNRVDGKRAFNFSVDLTVDEALTTLGDLVERAGVDEDIFFIMDKTDTVHKHRRMFLSRLAGDIEKTYDYFNNIRASIPILEVTA